MHQYSILTWGCICLTTGNFTALAVRASEVRVWRANNELGE